MRLIKPSYEIQTPLSDQDATDILSSIELAGRTCYKSEDKMDWESHLKFVKMILDRGHESVIEHRSLTIKFICDRGVSHELVRHRLSSFSQESTRYCNYSKDKFNNEITFIIPEWFDTHYHDMVNWAEGYMDNGVPPEDVSIWLFAIRKSETAYNKLIEQGWQPQQARSVLPNSLKTEIVVTANLRQWREIFRQRTAKAAHPQMRELMRPLLDELKGKLPIIFDDINYED